MVEIKKLNHDVTAYRLIRGWVARLLEKSYNLSRANGVAVVEFSNQLQGGLDKFDLPTILGTVEDCEIIEGKRQPPLPESIEATLERYVTIEKLLQNLGQNISGLILSGSMSYGPFFNVRKFANIHQKETWNSDIDVVLVFNHSHGDLFGWEKFINSPLFNDNEKASFISRLRIFTDMHIQGQADVFTHRFDIVGSDFNLGMHCLPIDTFHTLFKEKLKVDLDKNIDVLFQLHDYKPTPFRRAICIEHGFDGSQIEYVVPTQEVVKEGVISTLSCHIISNGKFYPGLWQSMFLPEFSVLYDPTGDVTSIVDDYRNLLLARLSKERKNNPDSSLIYAHIRHQGFAPERYNRYGINDYKSC